MSSGEKSITHNLFKVVTRGIRNYFLLVGKIKRRKYFLKYKEGRVFGSGTKKPAKSS